MRGKPIQVNARPPVHESKAPAQLPAAAGPERHPGARVTDYRVNVAPKSRRLHRKEAAVHLGVSLSWLDKARMVGRGPAFIAIGSRVVYDLADLDAFLRQNRRETGFGP